MQSSFPQAKAFKALEKDEPKEEIRAFNLRIEALKREAVQIEDNNRDCLKQTEAYISSMMTDRFYRGLSNDKMANDLIFSERLGSEKPGRRKLTSLRC